MGTKYKYGSYAFAAAALGCTTQAKGGVVLIDNPDVVITVDTYFDLDGDLVDDFLLDLTAQDDPSVHWTPLGSNTNVQDTLFVAALTPGFEISSTLPPGLKYGTNSQLLQDKNGLLGNWTNDLNNPALIGLAFDIGGNTHYGWVRVGVAVDDVPDTARAIIYDWAYEDQPDTSILAGDVGVPEPSSLALMALGAAGIAALKLRRRA